MNGNEEARVALLAEVEGISDEELNKKPTEDEWSIKQIMEHLYLMEKNVVELIEVELANEEIINVEDKPIHLTVNRKVKVEAPDELKPSENYATLKELTEKLDGSRQKLITLVDHTDENVLEQKAIPHPAFKMMNLKQWIAFIGWHEKRHTLQIKEVKKKIGL